MRKFNLNEGLNIGDFAVLYSISKNGEKITDVIMVRTGEYTCQLYQNDWSGANNFDFLPRNIEAYIKAYYRYSWSIDAFGTSIYEMLDGSRYIFEDIVIDARPHSIDAYCEDGMDVEKEIDYKLSSYESEEIYKGIGSYHSHSGRYNNPIKNSKADNYKIGIELEVEFQNRSQYSDFVNKSSNWFYKEQDGSLGGYGCEIITIPLLSKDAKSRKTWKKLIEDLNSMGARSWDTGRCGLHCHFSRTMFGRDEEEQLEAIAKMCWFYDHYLHDEEFNIKVYGRSSSYSERSGKTSVAAALATIGTDILKHKDVKDKVLKASKDVHDGARYFDINTRNRHTIEFRKGKGSINANRIIAIIEYNELIAKYAIKTNITKMSVENFKDFVRKSLKDDSPLWMYFGADR